MGSMAAKCDIVIVGAGPVGAYLASLLEEDFDIKIIDYKKPGQKACSGLISTNLDRFVKVPESVEHRISSAVIHSPSGNELVLSKKSTAAYVIDRSIFDRELADRLSVGIVKSRVLSVNTSKASSVISTDHGRLEADVVIGCDGSTSVVGRSVGQRPKELLGGIIALTQKKDASTNVELFFDKKFVTDGFLWKIPRGSRTEYGAMGSGVRYKSLESFFGLKGYVKASAPIPMGPCKSYAERLILVGDAAAHVKPWSGGGIIFGFTAAKMAAEVLKKCFAESTFTEDSMKAYESLWRRAFGKEISFGLMGREMLKDMTNKDLDELLIQANGMKASHLDMDFPVFSSVG